MEPGPASKPAALTLDGAAGDDDGAAGGSAGDDDEMCATIVGPNGGSHTGCAGGADDGAGGGDETGSAGRHAEVSHLIHHLPGCLPSWPLRKQPLATAARSSCRIELFPNDDCKSL